MVAEANFQYELARSEERFGDVQLQIESLKNLNETIDSLFARLEATGDTRLLEDLCPYFGVVWPSARALCRKVAALPGKWVGKKVLELGCGLALPSLLATRLGASVTATDFHPEVPRFLERNWALNSTLRPAHGLHYVKMAWQDFESPLGRFDYVIGSDILYERYQPAIVAHQVALNLKPEGLAILADPGRPYIQQFHDEMKSLGFSAQTEVDEEIFLLSFSRVLS